MSLIKHPSRRVALLLICSLVLLVSATRLLPLSISDLPFNNDGLTESELANDIVESGSLPGIENGASLRTQSMMIPALNVLLAFSSSLTGCSTFTLTHVYVVVSSLVAVLSCFIISRDITGSYKAAYLAGLFIALFGTAVFLTGSAWKESLGFSMYALLIYVYMKRQDSRMFALEICIIAVLPIVHHLVTIVAYLSITFLTIYHVSFAFRKKSLRRRHFAELLVIGLPSAAVFLYYYEGPVEKLSYVTDSSGALGALLIFSLVTIAGILILSRKKHLRFSFAPAAFVLLLSLVVLNQIAPLFPYVQGTDAMVLMLIVSYCILIFFAWLGFEMILKTSSVYRAIPLGVFLPTLMIASFAIYLGSSLESHQIIYRSFDLADLSLAIGLAVCIWRLEERHKVQTMAVAFATIALIASFPFAYASGSLIGVRHDTQGYEVDAVEYASVSTGMDMTFQSDERISYIAMALYGFQKLPTLPGKLATNASLNLGVVYAFEEEWTTVGVNDYPRGHPVLDSRIVELTVLSSNVLYVGGPHDNQIVLFTYSVAGNTEVFN